MAVSVAALGAEEERHVASVFAAIESAEMTIIAAIERECEALRAGRHLAAMALHINLHDGARSYIAATKAAWACIGLLNRCAPEAVDWLERRRQAFSSVLQIELSTLMAERARSEAAYRHSSRVVAA